jgi:hypothetical protein
LTKKPHVLIVDELYAGGNPERKALSSGHVPKVEGLRHSRLADVSEIHPDAKTLVLPDRTKYKYMGEATLVQYCRETRPDLIFFDPICRCPDPPTPERVALAYLVWGLGLKMGGMLWDGGPCSVDMFERYYPFCEFVGLWDSFDPTPYTTNPQRWEWNWWFPSHPDYINDPGFERDINVSIPGSVGTEGPRFDMIQEMSKRGIEVTFLENTSHNIPIKDFYTMHQRSKIVISESGGGRIKWRPFESIGCGALTLEPETTTLSNYFEPWKEYVPYTTSEISSDQGIVVDYDNVADLIHHFLGEDEARVEIAKAGYDRLHKEYTTATWWKKYLGHVGLL